MQTNSDICSDCLGIGVEVVKATSREKANTTKLPGPSTAPVVYNILYIKVYTSDRTVVKLHLGQNEPLSKLPNLAHPVVFSFLLILNSFKCYHY